MVACVDNRGADTKWEKLLLIFNCGSKTAQYTLPEGSWQILVNDASSFCWEKNITAANTVEPAANTALILGLKK